MQLVSYTTQQLLHHKLLVCRFLSGQWQWTLWWISGFLKMVCSTSKHEVNS